MKRTTTGILVLAFATIAAPAFADGDSLAPLPFVSTRSRAEVVAETLQARDAGLLGEDAQYRVAKPDGIRTRADVRAEFLASRRQTEKIVTEAGAPNPDTLLVISHKTEQQMDVQ